MSELKVIEWNINQRSGSSHTEKQIIPPLVCEEIAEQNADIVVLTEFYKTTNWVEFISGTFAEYNVFYTMNPKDQNDIFIAIKRKYHVSHVEYLHSERENNNPNCLRVDVTINNVDVCLIGVRICISNGKRKDYECRKKQFDLMCRLIDKTKKVLILGDFNNSRNIAPQDASYSNEAVRIAYKGKDSEPYNYHLIKQAAKENYLKIETPADGYSWGGYIKNDHMIITSDAEVKTCHYDWNFVKRSDPWPDSIGYPDHAILAATIKLND